MGLGGIAIDLSKALELAIKANELSKKNDYDDIVEMIQRAINVSIIK
ncbi:MAG: hypothetical protein RLZZ175_663 [Bacteroidota bacterium]|jgi:hypothetical protein